MYKLNIAICEDEEMEFNRLISSINKVSENYFYDYYQKGEDLLSRFFYGKYDMIFMDIYMDGSTGVEIVKKIREIDKTVPIAFVTTSKDHALDGYMLRVNRYIQKPVQDTEVKEFIELATREMSNLPGFETHVNGKLIFIPFSKLKYAEQDNHYVYLYITDNIVHKTRGKLAEIEKLVTGLPFMRCHQSFLVNLAHVSDIDTSSYCFFTDEGDTVYIRRNSISQALKLFEEYTFNQVRNQ